MSSPVGPAVVEIAHQMLTGKKIDEDDVRFDRSLTVLEAGYKACSEATDEQIRAGHMAELMFGLAGFLFAQLGLRGLVSGSFAKSGSGKLLTNGRDSRLARLASDVSIESVVHAIIRSGINGSQFMLQSAGNWIAAPLLMWRYCRVHWSLINIHLLSCLPVFNLYLQLGGIHGVAGVLLILLHCPRQIIDRYLHSHILPTLDWLLSLQRFGNTARDYPLDHAQPAWQCQFCHRATGTALLLSGLRDLVPEAVTSSTDKSGSRRKAPSESLAFLWKEGIVRKCIDISHGVTGNAMPLLLEGMFDLRDGVQER